MTTKFNVIKNFVSTRWLKKFKTRRSLEKYQDKMIKKQVKFLRNNSKFYQDISSIDTLPITDKIKMMNNFNLINTVGIDKEEALEIALTGERTRNFSEKCKGITVGLSSGTSGHRGMFIVSEKEQGMWAGAVLAKLLPKGRIFNNKIAFFLRANSNLYESVKSKVIDFNYFDIQKPMEENIQKLGEYNPTLLVAPPSVLIQIAKAQEEKKISISPIKIISVAEVLEKKDEDYIKKVFDKKIIHQVYQCTEGFLGYTCECGSFHINEDIVKIEKEWLDEKRFIPIITDFRRRSQPIIRYRLNDILVTEKKQCKCGSALLVIEKIEGRDDDIFIFDAENGQELKVFPDFIRRCILFVDGIRDYRVQQLNKEWINIEINAEEDVQNLIIEEFRKLSEQMNFKLPKFTFSEYVTDTTKKLKRIERKFKEEVYEKC